jgi:predicted DNA-binding transcriptional regulator YafY
MYHPTTRVLAVLDLLQTHGRLTGADLARRLEVNIRTLRRYITILQDLGIPITAERGPGGAYELQAGFRLPPMMFTNGEAQALAIGLLAARRLGQAEAAAAVESARAKLERVMPLDLKSQVRALTETIQLDVCASPVSPSGDAMLTLSSAAQRRRRVHMLYQAGGRQTERAFDPYGLAHREGKWYVVGWCHLRGCLRSFRMDRVVQVVVTGDRFDRPDDFDALKYVVQAIATLPRQFSFEVFLKTHLAGAQREIMAVFGTLEPCENGVLLRGSTDDLDWVARELASFSFPFVVRAPDALRAALRRRAAELAGLANGE